MNVEISVLYKSNNMSFTDTSFRIIACCPFKNYDAPIIGLYAKKVLSKGEAFNNV
ncbi:hypothetical protein JCM21738_2941 [Mesobacillus boroniphilus JCM 21738]|uniref:Uncharacterized protein n=1 Tax=Mesobacillus boroniphilus JCM 21738 TaxID=1294265 RepID=W4RNS7_9BACI|nr:hypothetical protein JCM21738_2941 [Mesobacillus boroniphilus JCM 21738]